MSVTDGALIETDTDGFGSGGMQPEIKARHMLIAMIVLTARKDIISSSYPLGRFPRDADPKHPNTGLKDLSSVGMEQVTYAMLAQPPRRATRKVAP